MNDYNPSEIKDTHKFEAVTPPCPPRAWNLRLMQLCSKTSLIFFGVIIFIISFLNLLLF